MYGNVKTTVTGTVSSLWGSAVDIADQTKRGWENTKDQVEVPDWIQKIMHIQEEVGMGKSGGDRNGDGKGSSGGAGGPPPPQESRVVAGAAAGAAGATAAAYGYQDDDNDDRTPEEISKDDQMMILTKKMIEIRNILQQVGQSSTLTLPSIVVIGSQSSGKSSVLEAIVGHEFLPKGSNMVTRRPIELTLINTPNSKTEYGEFPDLGRKMTDFTAIQRTLTELNLSVPDEVCVSDDPIHLRIYSPNVPDLSLIDLPGYIQVVGHNQPLELKQKISELCDKYIQAPNVILAISAADVDLANSTALQASRKVDPRGERTIGVITKMDLVDPTRGASILSDKQYPLRLGYVGVVSKVPQQTGLFKRDTGNLLDTVSRNERAFFSAHPTEFGTDSGNVVGTNTLRRKLMHVLERTMSASLQSTTDTIQRELTEADYQFKALYNSRTLTAKSHLARSLDEFKHAYRKMEDSFGPEQVYDLVKDALDQQVLDQLALRYWNKPIADLSPSRPDEENVADLPKADPETAYWKHQLDGSVAALTTMGVGRAATGVIKSAILTKIRALVDQSPFSQHPTAREKIVEAASDILDDLYARTSDQVENSIKPFKPLRNRDKQRDIKVEGPEWESGREHAANLLNAELSQCQGALKELEKVAGGRWKLKEVMNFVDKARKGSIMVEETRHGAGGFSAQLLAQGTLPAARRSCFFFFFFFFFSRGS
jgi:replication fork clamp-binding protein CrfC